MKKLINSNHFLNNREYIQEKILYGFNHINNVG